MKQRQLILKVLAQQEFLKCQLKYPWEVTDIKTSELSTQKSPIQNNLSRYLTPHSNAYEDVTHRE